MTARRPGPSRPLILLAVLSLAGVSAQAAENNFHVEVDENGRAKGQCDGPYPDWYLYPNTGWWNQWFYNGPLDMDRKKVIDVVLKIKVLNPESKGGSIVRIAYNWATPEWPPGSPPPLPEDVPKPAMEEEFIKRDTMFEANFIPEGGSTFDDHYEIEDYNPEWVSIDVQGSNFVIDGVIKHECVPKDGTPETQACCFDDGQCENLTPEECKRKMGVSQGVGTKCLGDNNNNRIDDACEQAPTKCAPTADGQGCLSVVCPDPTEVCVPTKIRLYYQAGAAPRYTVLSCACQSANLCHVAIDPPDTVYCVGGCPSGQKCELRKTDNGDGSFDYECVCTAQPPPTEACCLPDGTCIDVDRQTCQQRGGTPQGPGTNCNTVVCPQPTQACCLPDGTCEDLTPTQCAEKGGTPQGSGTNCNIVVCPGPGECDWNPGDPVKMHHPQLPDLDPTGVAFALHPIDGYADDFLCTVTGPILDIHIWGAFRSDIGPADGPDSLTLELAIYSNVPADDDKPYSRPGTRLWARRFSPDEYTVRLVHEGEQDWWENGIYGEYLKGNHKQTYQYNFCIDEKPFTQEKGTIYWLEVKDIRPDNANYKFGWKSTALELRWNDDAVWHHGGSSRPQTYPDGHRYQGQTLDFAFVITGEEGPPPQPQACCFDDGTCQNLTPGQCAEKGGTPMGVGTDCSTVDCLPAGECDWNEGDPHKMHWAQLPDLTPAGIDVEWRFALTSVGALELADDFLCTANGPIKDIHIWCSFKDDILPPDGLGSVTFRVSIYSNVPADDEIPWSGPGTRLWSRRFGPGEYTVRKVHEGPQGWYKHREDYDPANHLQVFQYNFCIDEEPFVQEEGIIYWLVISHASRGDFKLGWKTTQPELRWNDDAVQHSSASTTPDPRGFVSPLKYPEGHEHAGQTLDLAFVITGEPGPPPPPQACCFDDGTCQNLTPGQCTEKGGTPMGVGTDCSTMDCLPAGECDWNPDDPYKMHWPQLPDFTPTGLTYPLEGSQSLADDFLCTATGPIRDIHIWGGFLYDGLPTDGPGGVTFQLAFYSNRPADADEPYSSPRWLLWSRTFGPGQYTVRKVYEGPQTWLEDCLHVAPMPDGHTKTYQYNFCIEDEPFIQEEGTVYWLEVKETSTRRYGRTFGWKTTSPELGWQDVAVMGASGRWYPRGPESGPRRLDFAFVITGEPGPPPPPQACCFDDATCQNLTPGQCVEQGGIPQGTGTDCAMVDCIPVGECDWNPGDPHKMHWAQLPDLNPTGMAISAWCHGKGLADDFLCTVTGSITDIHIWGAFKDDILPADGPGSLTFHVGIWANLPADDNVPYSQPLYRPPLWTRTFEPGQYTVRKVHEGPEGWCYVPGHHLSDNHKQLYQYNFCIEEEPFIQEEGTIYWLSIAYQRPDDDSYTFGWKTTPPEYHWSDDAVWFNLGWGWLPLTYPDGHEYEGHTVDLAFVITGEEGPPPQPQACCLDDGTCQNLTPAQCAEKGGTPMGVGTDCANVICPGPGPGECIWQVGDPHKMHFPQLPDPQGWDLDVTGGTSGSWAGASADDWLCTATGPVTDIHFWYSWKEDKVGTIEKIHVRIRSNITADDPSNAYDYSVPGDVLWAKTFGPDEFNLCHWGTGDQGFTFRFLGEHQFALNDHKNIYQCDIVDIADPFVQQAGRIYWLQLHVTVSDPENTHIGWKTSLERFEDSAVYDINWWYWRQWRHPLTGEPWDLAFVITGEEGPPPPPQACCLPDGTCIDTAVGNCLAQGGTPMGVGTDCASVICPGPGPGGCIWQVGDPHKMHFPQLPNRQGWDVDVTAANLLADDWKCSATGPVTDIHFWYSWLKDRVGIIDHIRVGIYSNIPAEDSATGYSIPGKLLWERAFGRGQFNLCFFGQGNQGFMMGSDGVPNDHRNIYQCDIVGIPNPFIQHEGTIYWLALSVMTRDPLGTHIGWKTSLEQFEDDAVFDAGPDGWMELIDPVTGNSLDLAFVITGEEVPVCDWNEGDPHKMHHPQLPDLSPLGVDVDMALTGLADDFKCSATGPIKDIHIWGSFADDILPNNGPASLTFQVSIYTDVPAGAVQPWSMPGELVWSRQFGPGQYTVRKVHDGPEDWYDPVTGAYMRANHQQAYQYNFCIEDEPFVQTEGRIYWLQIKDIPPQEPDYTFGWKTTTRELRWNDDAVFGQPDLGWQALTYPAGHEYKGQTLDLAFVITGEEVPPCDWNEGDPHKMHWPQKPDLTDTGVDVDMFWSPLADDFKCTASGPIQDIHIWGSFADDILPMNGPGSLTFRLTIYSDVPAGPIQPWSMPGEPLWTRDFAPGEYSVRLVHEGPEDWYDPATEVYLPNNHRRAYQYNFCIEEEPFLQEAGNIYWLEVKDIAPANPDYTFGWKTTLATLRWNDDAVYLNPNIGWLPLVYPAGHRYEGQTLDLAFVITGGAEVRPEHDLGDAPDGSNSWPGSPVMTAYPGVKGKFPTVYQVGSPPVGPIHWQPKALAFLGNAVSLENEADIGPDEDGVNNIDPPNDSPNQDQADDGVNVPLTLPHCQKTTFDYVVTVVNPIYRSIYANVWFDWNRDGDWSDVLECPDGTVVPEWAVQNQQLNLSGPGVFTFTTPEFMCWHPPVPTDESPIWMRITLAEQSWGMVAEPGEAGGDGPAGGYDYGETEDYTFVPKPPAPPEYDFGDAPTGDFAPAYPTLLVHTGARHVIRGPWLGDDDDQPDPEPDGQPDPAALGDDHDILYGPANDDEDGAFIPPLVRGATTDVTVRVNGGGGIVKAWIDFDGNHIWQIAECIHNGFLPDGTHNIAVTVPNSAVLGQTFARFRISSTGGLGPAGLASDGEVEDHEVFIEEPPPDIKWPQWPDLTPNGINIRVDTSDGKLRTLADDFKCTSYTRLTDVHLWCSWKDDIKGQIKRIHLSIHPDDPAGPGGWDPENPYSQPDQEVLWARDFGPDEFTETLYWTVPEPGEWWWDLVTGELIPGGDQGVWQLDIYIDPAEAFLQKGSPDMPITYWLDVQVDTEGGQLGWKTRRWPDHYMDDAVWDAGSELPRLWNELRYPAGHPYHGLERDSIDMAFVITGREEAPPPKPAAEHLKWSQPPVEIDPRSKTPLYCGWDELSFSAKPDTVTAVLPRIWRMVADDFRCLGTMPITSVHWWGSYEVWDDPEPPAVRPTGWRIGFWSNVPANPLTKPGHSFPRKLLWQIDVPADRVHEERVGIDQFWQRPGNNPPRPSETCFQYYVKLTPEEYFWQHRYIDPDTKDDVFWISITAMYPVVTSSEFRPWGWKTRPWHWMDDAVKFRVENELPTGYVHDLPLAIEPIEETLCGERQSFDMAFELNTDPDYIKWEQPFTGLRNWRHYEDEQSMAVVTTGGTKWRQPPDLSEMGMDVDATDDIPPTWRAQALADDFKCEASGPITHIRIWASWLNDILPANYPENVVFTLRIYKDIPASESITDYSMPGEVLWERKFERGQFTGTKHAENLREGWYVPCTPEVGYKPAADTVCWQYDFDIPTSEAFPQDKGRIYWLGVQAQLVHTPLTEGTRFGWKTSTEHWNDDAVWRTDIMPISRPWEELRYPDGHEQAGQSIDLAFEITTGAGEEQLDIRRLVADDWPCDQQTPITAAVWWGSYIGYRYRACDCPTMTPPTKPDYFLLSIWNDVRPSADVPYSHPGEKVWEYKADDYDEVLVGYDKHPEILDPTQAAAFEPVFRYSVRLPKEKWFCQKEVRAIYWFSVVAVYEGDKEPPYPWGWTNHKCVAWEPPDLVEVLHWKLDETGGPIAKDSSGQGNDGTLVGDPTWQPCEGKICGALDLDGDGDYVKVDSPTGLDFAPGSFSASAWVNAREVTDGWRTILEYDRGGSNWFGLWLSSEGRFHFRVGSDTKNSNQTLNSDEWYLLTATYDATTKRMSLYINGQFDASHAHSIGYGAAKVAKLTVGVRGMEDAEYFDGLLDDVRIYSFALSADNVRALADMGRNDDAVAGRLATSDGTATWKWEELYDQTDCSEDMSFMLFTEPGCFPCQYSTYNDWLALGKPNCWCEPPYGSGYQCDADADGKTSGFPFHYRVFTADLRLLVDNWQKKLGDPTLDPCADIDHKDSGFPFYYRVFTSDLSRLVSNWQKKDAQLAGDCPRPE